ncbi:MAG: aminoacetone oxidase family FAD-binding enzyme [Bacteroidales bacterium]|jgi:predicted Rossmann fold flavoprotein|nr:aminoacetone oxidase family FAD-binding enzyme [Bacteroidales bacterium]
MTDYDIIIAGGGSSGIMACIAAIKHGKRVLLVEKMPQLCLKLRISGKGRGNISNTADIKTFMQHTGSEPRFLYPSFNTFFTKDLRLLLSNLGLETKEERGGRIFPISEKAQDVFLTLVKHIETSPYCTIIKNHKLQSVIYQDDMIVGVRLLKGNKDEKPIEYRSNAVVLALGGLSYPQTGSCGDWIEIMKSLNINIVEPVPALVGLCCDNAAFEHHFTEPFLIKNAAVIAFDANERKLYEIQGEIEFRSFGVSGAAVLTLSRQIARKIAANESITITIDLKPSVEQKKIDEELRQAFHMRGKEQIQSVLRQFLPAVLVSFFLDFSGIKGHKRAADITSDERKSIIKFIKSLKLNVVGTEGWHRAVITQGGISLREVNPKTLQIKSKKGLYVCGEMLDLDADTGGYNLQIAFSTGYLAGQSAASQI